MSKLGKKPGPIHLCVLRDKQLDWSSVNNLSQYSWLALIIVVLPHPLGPSRQYIAPLGMAILMLSRTGDCLLLNLKTTFSSKTAGVLGSMLQPKYWRYYEIKKISYLILFLIYILVMTQLSQRCLSYTVSVGWMFYSNTVPTPHPTSNQPPDRYISE